MDYKIEYAKYYMQIQQDILEKYDIYVPLDVLIKCYFEIDCYYPNQWYNDKKEEFIESFYENHIKDLLSLHEII